MSALSSDAMAGLVAFARERLAADRYRGDRHPVTAFTCGVCGLVPLELTIHHHTGSRAGDFKGVIEARCTACGREERIFSFTGQHRSFLRSEKPVCGCGERAFLVAMVERFEGDDGLPGFFDEGVIVGECFGCGRRVAFVYID